MIHSSVGPDDAIELLNQALELDREAVSALAMQQHPCNAALGAHETIQVRRLDDGRELHSVGMIGILNGIWGIDANGWGAIAAVTEQGSDLIERFVFAPDYREQIQPRDGHEPSD